MADRNDVARMAGVSGATVSRVFNHPLAVSLETRTKVLNAAQTLNYHPNSIARNFVKGITGNIGIIVPRIPGVHVFSTYYFSEILSGIGDALEEDGYNLVLFFHKENSGEGYLKYFQTGKVDGCILLGTRKDDASLMLLQKAGYPFCLINNYIEDSGISFVDADNVAGSYAAVNHLLRLGHRHIAFLNGPMHYSNSLDRLSGYQKALAEENIPFNEALLLQGNYGRKSGTLAVKRFLELEPRPTAIFVSNDRMAAGFLEGLRQNHLSIPQDVAVVGYDDSDIASIVEPPLTTVKVPFFELGRQCAGEFLKCIQKEGGISSFELFLRPELIIRKSSGT